MNLIKSKMESSWARPLMSTLCMHTLTHVHIHTYICTHRQAHCLTVAFSAVYLLCVPWLHSSVSWWLERSRRPTPIHNFALADSCYPRSCNRSTPTRLWNRSNHFYLTWTCVSLQTGAALGSIFTWPVCTFWEAVVSLQKVPRVQDLAPLNMPWGILAG